MDMTFLAAYPYRRQIFLEEKRVRTRFAPSPTGYMHIGNLRTALYAYLFAKANDGDFILRIEDTDRTRYVADAVDFIKNTLKAAHIIPDEGPGYGGDYGPYVQSERKDVYLKYANELIEKGYAYRCFCDPKSDETHGKFGGYPGTCRDLPKETIEKNLAEGKPFVIRQKMPKDGSTTFHDMLHGNITIDNDTLEDQVLIKRDGMPTYNFAHVVDDHLMKVTHVIRGAEFITSTPKHVLLYKGFGWETPAFIHLPAVMGKGEDGSVSKLSKRHGATSFNELVEMGYLPEAVTNYVALLGWSPKSNQEIFTMEEMEKSFSLDGLSKSPAIFDYNKLDWMNGEYFKKMDPREFASESRGFAGDLPENIASKWDYLAGVLQSRISRYDEIPDQIHFFMAMPAFDAELYRNKRNKVTPEKSADILPEEIEGLSDIDDWTPDGINAKLAELVEKTGLKKGLLMWPIRIAASGQKVTPGGVTEILYVLGKDESISRLKASLESLRGYLSENN